MCVHYDINTNNAQHFICCCTIKYLNDSVGQWGYEGSKGVNITGNKNFNQDTAVQIQLDTQIQEQLDKHQQMLLEIQTPLHTYLYTATDTDTATDTAIKIQIQEHLKYTDM